MASSLSFNLAALVCCKCGLRIEISRLNSPINELKFSNGCCPKCLTGRFDVTVTKVAKFSDGPSGSDMGGAMVASALTGGALIFTAQGQSGSATTDYELPDIEGETILKMMELPPDQIQQTLSALQKQAAKANLQPNQGVCVVCGDIFTKGLVGYTLEGFCSPSCKRKHLAATPGTPVAPAGPVASTTASVTAMPCPHCKRTVKLKALPGKCIWCGKVIAG